MEGLAIAMVGSGMIPIPPPGHGAVEKHIWNLAKALEARGHHVEILNRALGSRPWNEYRFAMWARPRARAAGKDIVHLHTTGVAYTFHALGPRGYIYTSHSRHWTRREGLGERLGFALERRAVAGARRVIALSDRMARLMTPLASADVVPNGVDTDLYRPDYAARPGNRIVAVGRVEPHKGFHLAAEALEHHDASLIIVGPAPPGPYVERLRRHPSVTVTGEITEEALRRYLATSDIYVHPSASEAFSLAVVEAMASGLPVVGTEVCEGQVEEGRNGFVVGGRTEGEVVAAFRERLDTLLADPGLRLAMGRRGRALAEERYRWTSVAAQVEEVYRRALGDGPPVRRPGVKRFNSARG